MKYRNRGDISITGFNQAIQQFETEVVNSTEVVKEHATVDHKEAARQLIHDYPINSSDAYILQCALDKANELRMDGHDLILVSSDTDLLKAARSEGLRTFNPETNAQAYLDGLINT